jgi:hypothetical protein
MLFCMYTSASCEKSVSCFDVSHSLFLNHFMLHESQDCGVPLIIIGFSLLRRFHCSLFRPRKEVCLSVCLSVSCVPRGWRPQRNANLHLYRHVLYELMKYRCLIFVLLVTMSRYFVYHSHKSEDAWNHMTERGYSFQRERPDFNISTVQIWIKLQAFHSVQIIQIFELVYCQTNYIFFQYRLFQNIVAKTMIKVL